MLWCERKISLRSLADSGTADWLCPISGLPDVRRLATDDRQADVKLVRALPIGAHRSHASFEMVLFRVASRVDNGGYSERR